MSHSYIVYEKEVIDKYEELLESIKGQVSEYYTQLLKEPFDINNYIDVVYNEKLGCNGYWVSMDKMSKILEPNKLIVWFDFDASELAYRATPDNGSLIITHVDVIRLKDFQFIFGLKRTSKEYKEKHGFKTYLMLDKSTQFVKIGRAKNPKYRERTLQSEKPVIDLIFVINEDVEAVLHQRYVDKRVRGEWFNLTKTDIETIKLEFSS